MGVSMKPYSKEFVDSFVDAYSHSVACASDEGVRAFLLDFTAGMAWEQIHDKHEYSSNIYDALCMFEAGMVFQKIKPKGG
jgi:hypothetical protein